MNKIVLFLATLLVAIPAAAKGDWKGKVVDEKGEPVAYANVAVLSKADSTVVCGVTTEEDGTFNIITKETDGIMMVAMLGYKTQYLAPVDGAVICLVEDSSMLQSALATAVMPKTKITGEGLQTGVRGSVLENVGTANDVLAKTPGIIKNQDGLQVIGKGAPLVYINGRKVTDASELDRLQSNEIQSVEVITNPGAQYDATVKAVVRIKTIRRQGDGFGFNFNASDAQSLRWDKGNRQSGAVNANYRTGGLDFFGGINYIGNAMQQISDAETASFFVKDGKVNSIKNIGAIKGEGFEGELSGNAGVNWQMADNHFIGGKLEWGRDLYGYESTTITSDVYENDVLVDRLTTVTDDKIGSPAPGNLGANIYYNGLIGGKLGVDVNVDYFGNHKAAESAATETSDMTADANPTATTANKASMYATKAVLSYPIWMGQLQAGTEETFTRRWDVYQIQGVSIPASSALVSEDNYAGFASYGFYLPQIGQLSAGVRYEYVHYSYQDQKDPSQDIVKDYGNWFPTFSYAGIVGPVQMMLSYSAKTQRPKYSQLTSAIRYNSRYIFQGGNAGLQPQISHNIGLTAVWNYVTLMLNYTRTNDAIMTWSAPYVKEGLYDGIVLVRPENIDTPYRNLTALVNLTPTIGPWTLNYTLGTMPQWLTMTMKDPREASGERTVSFNGKPIFFAELLNTLTLNGGWQLELGGTVQSKGYGENVYLNNTYCDLTAAVQKVLLKDGSLILRLEGEDLLGLAHNDIVTDFGSHYINQVNQFDHQRIKFSVRYSFNRVQSKYRGTGAGADNKGRMK